AGPLGALVKRVMLAAVDRFLGRERLDLGGKLGRRALPERAHAFDKERLSFREGGRQRIVDSRRFDPPAVPQSGGADAAAEAAVTGGDAEIVRSRKGRATHSGMEIE